MTEQKWQRIGNEYNLDLGNQSLTLHLYRNRAELIYNIDNNGNIRGSSATYYCETGRVVLFEDGADLRNIVYTVRNITEGLPEKRWKAVYDNILDALESGDFSLELDEF